MRLGGCIGTKGGLSSSILPVIEQRANGKEVIKEGAFRDGKTNDR
jgi:hypothetical protein